MVNGSDPSKTEDFVKSIIRYFNIYLTPLLVVIGVVGNIMSFLVFAISHLRRQSSSVYLACLALADTGFLLALFLSWFSWLKINVMHVNGACHLVVYLTYVCGFLSVWSIAAYTVERYIVVTFPFKRHLMCTVKRSLMVVVSLSLFALLAYSFSLWTSGIVQSRGEAMCQPLPHFFGFVYVLSNIDTILTLLIPMLVIVVLNMKIVFTLYKFYHRRQSMTSDSDALVEWRRLSNASTQKVTLSTKVDHRFVLRSRDTINRRACALQKRSQIKITRMLLIVSTMFIILNAPSHAIRLHGFILFAIYKTNISRTEIRCQELLQFLYYTSFSINFFLYSLCGKNFRKGLLQLGRRFKYKVGKIFHLCIFIVYEDDVKSSKQEIQDLQTFIRKQ